MRAMSSGARSDLKFGGSLTHAAAAADDARGASDRAGAGPPISGRRSWSEHARLHRPTITVIIEPSPLPIIWADASLSVQSGMMAVRQSLEARARTGGAAE